MAVETFKIINGVKTPVSSASVDAAMRNKKTQDLYNKLFPNAKEVHYDGNSVSVKNDNGASYNYNVNGSKSVLGNPSVLPDIHTGTKVQPVNANPVSYSPAPTVPLTDSGNKAYEGADDVMLTEYFAGRPNARVVWNDGTKNVYINGVAVPKSEVYLSPDGKSFVSRSLAEQIYRSSQANDASSSFAMQNRYDRLYGEMADELKRLRSKGDFEYNYRNDPSFKAYSDYYDALADKAVDDALASLMSRTGGYVNSNALAAAYQARNDYMRQKSNIIPQLEQQAYERWSTERQQRAENVSNALSNLRALASDYTNANLGYMELENRIESSVLDRALEREGLYIDDDNTKAALEAQVKQWQVENGISFASLSIQEQKQLLDEWIAKEEYGKKPVINPTIIPPADTGSDTLNKGLSFN